MKGIHYLLVVAACGSDGGSDGGSSSFFGTYAATRTVTESEPSPSFQFPLDMTVTIDATSVDTSSGHQATNSMISGTRITFRDGETWSSPEGDGAVNLDYTLDVPGDGTLRGTIAAHVIFDQPPIFGDFDYTLSIEGALIAADRP
jgi:hypothetical protein